MVWVMVETGYVRKAATIFHTIILFSVTNRWNMTRIGSATNKGDPRFSRWLVERCDVRVGIGKVVNIIQG